MDQVGSRSQVERFIRELVSATQARNIYGKGHNLTKEAVDRLYSTVTSLLTDRKEMTVGIIGDEIAFEKEPFYELSGKMANLISRLKKMEIEKISVLKGASKEELLSFIEILGGKPVPPGSKDGFDAALTSRGITHITVGAIGIGGEGTPEVSLEEVQAIANASFQDGVGFLEKTVKDLSGNRPIDANAARFFVNKMVSTLLKNMHSLLILTSIKKRDEYTFVHSINVAIFTLVQAEAIGLGKELLTDIGMAALLHDTGKMAMEGEIIRKGGKLDPEELEKMQSHPIDGAKVLLETPEIGTLAGICAFEHHLNYDMQGYPSRLYGTKINLVSMMITISDVYDALRSKRSYHEPSPPERVYEEMQKMSGKHFNPELLEIFFNTIGVYPPGTLVELDSQEIGLVIKESSFDIRRPRIEILYDSKGEIEKAPRIVNLLEKPQKAEGYKRTIVRSVAISDKYEIPGKYLAG